MQKNYTKTQTKLHIIQHRKPHITKTKKQPFKQQAPKQVTKQDAKTTKHTKNYNSNTRIAKLQTKLQKYKYKK